MNQNGTNRNEALVRSGRFVFPLIFAYTSMKTISLPFKMGPSNIVSQHCYPPPPYSMFNRHTSKERRKTKQEV